MLQKGQLINGVYEIIRPVGEGGAGLVYLAYHRNLRKQVVVKRLKTSYSAPEHLRQEADILKGLHHPNLPQVYDFLMLGDGVYTVIDYVDGNSMAEYIEAGVKFDEVQLIRWLKKLLDALQYLHSRNPAIIHSDIKPANIMIDRNGEICLIDFNVSSGGHPENEISGYSPRYASPEQLARAELLRQGKNTGLIIPDARTDLYSLSVSFYELMTGENPAKLREQGARPFSAPSPYSSELEKVLSKGMSYAPKNRYVSAEEMKSDLLGMKRRDREAVALRRGQTGFTVIFILLAVAGLTISAIGFIRGRSLALQNQIADLRNLYEDGEYRDVEKEGVRILNEMNYSSGEKAAILYLVGDSFSMEQAGREAPDYSQAVDFLEEAWELNQEDWDCGVAYAWALGMDGDAEYSDEVFGTVLDGCDDSRILRRMGLRWSELRELRGDFAGAADVLSRVMDKAGDDAGHSLLAKKAGIYRRLAQETEGSGAAVADADLAQDAQDTNRKLAEITGDTEDWMQCAEVVRLLNPGEPDPLLKAEDTLRWSGKDDFRIYMRLAFYEFRRVDDGCSGASSAQAQAWYNESETRYAAADEETQAEYAEEMKRLRSLAGGAGGEGGRP